MALTSTMRPAPDGGMNTRDNPLSLAANEATLIENFVIDNGCVLLREGSTQVGLEFADASSRIELFKWGGLTQDWLVAAKATKLFTIPGGASAPTDITGTTTPSSANWNPLNMNNTLLLFNGVDHPQSWAGGAAAADLNFAGAGTYAGSLDSTAEEAKLIMATNYRNRIYILHDGLQIMWYGASNAISGNVDGYDLGYVFKGGGRPYLIATWSVDDGGGLDDRLVIMSTTGVTLVYGGSYPGGTDWTLLGQFFLPPPFTRRGVFNLGGDLFIMTTDAIISMKSVMEQGSTNYTTLTDKIGSTWRYNTRLRASNTGWKPIIAQDRQLLIINIPLSASTGVSAQLVMDIRSGAWTYFTGNYAWSLEALHAGSIGTYIAYNNFIYQLFSGYKDRGTAQIEGNLYCAPIVFGQKQKANFIKPLHTIWGQYNLKFGVTALEDEASAINDSRTGTSSTTAQNPRIGVVATGKLLMPVAKVTTETTAESGPYYKLRALELLTTPMGNGL